MQQAKIATISLLLLFINFTKGNPAGLNCLDKKGKSTPFVTRHCHVDTFDGDGAVCVVDGVQCEEVIVVRRGYSSPDLLTAVVCTVGIYERRVHDGRQNRCRS